MGTSVTLNGVTYTIPAVGESSWGTQVRNYLIAQSTGLLSKAGGAFTLTAETDFGASFGLKATSYKSRGTVSSAGVFRLGNAESIGWRNAANGGDKLLKVNASDQLEYDGVPVFSSAGLVLPSAGGTGVANNNAATLTRSGNHALTFTTSGTTGLTLPTTGTVATLAGSEIFTNKTLSGNTATNLISGSGTLTLNTTGTVTVPDATDTLVGKATSDVLTNKTLSGNTATNLISGSGTMTLNTTGTVTVPNATDTLVGKATTDDLTNKTLTSPKLNENVAVTTTATKLNYLTSATGTTGTTSTNVVFSTSPTLVTPVLGVATATSINKMAITAPATSSTLAVADGKTFTVSNTLTFTGTDTSSVAFGAGGTAAYVANKLSVFAATTSLELAGVISDETGSGKLVFATAPQFSTNIDLLAAAETRYYNAGGTFYTGFKGGNAGANKIWTLPTADGGANQLLKTDGSGALGWATAAATVTTTRGDIIYRAASADDRLAIGSAGKFLRAGASDPAWSWESTSSGKSADYTVTDTDGFTTILMTTAGTDRTVTLPTAADNTGRVLVIKKVDTGTGKTIVDGEGSETIDGLTTYSLFYQYDWVRIECDGTGWQVIGANAGTTPQAVTVTGAWSTNTTYTAKETRVGSWAYYDIHIALAGAPTSATLSVNLPSGRTIDTAKMSSGTNANNYSLRESSTMILDAGTAIYVGSVGYSSTTAVSPRYETENGVAPSSNNLVTQAAPFTFANNDLVIIKFAVPIVEFAHFR